jgi:hypothetical protein
MTPEQALSRFDDVVEALADGLTEWEDNSTEIEDSQYVRVGLNRQDLVALKLVRDFARITVAAVHAGVTR